MFIILNQSIRRGFSDGAVLADESHFQQYLNGGIAVDSHKSRRLAELSGGEPRG